MIQRIIKFRQWNPKKKIMFYDANFPFDGNEISINRQIELSQGIGTIWMQFTGLKDKNRKEIFEGDLLMENEYRAYPRLVKWDNDLGRWMLHGHNPKNKTSYRIGIRHKLKQSQIIGNLYENTELLEGDK